MACDDVHAVLDIVRERVLATAIDRRHHLGGAVAPTVERSVLPDVARAIVALLGLIR